MNKRTQQRYVAGRLLSRRVAVRWLVGILLLVCAGSSRGEREGVLPIAYETHIDLVEGKLKLLVLVDDKEVKLYAEAPGVKSPNYGAALDRAADTKRIDFALDSLKVAANKVPNEDIPKVKGIAAQIKDTSFDTEVQERRLAVLGPAKKEFGFLAIVVAVYLLIGGWKAFVHIKRGRALKW